MKRIAAAMVDGVVTSVLMEFVVYPVIYYPWKGWEMRREARRGGHELAGLRSRAPRGRAPARPYSRRRSPPSRWSTSPSAPARTANHVLFCGLYLLPVVAGAVWFGLRGALLCTSAIAAAYAGHVAMSWHHQPMENVNQRVTPQARSMLATSFVRS